MPTYNKLIRDKIPALLEEKQTSYQIEKIRKDDRFEQVLRKKLTEEVAEFLAANEKAERLEEIADIIEVLYALAQLDHVQPNQVEQIRQDKKLERGGFDQRLFLVSTTD
ncbi:nucleoside triphosphate pyrophosphohydrolase [Amphibacillus sediminis]|uniref:nucleoside triphosphate pyrophosphohydrolase n=1 Tax=Amphibacillus sediminis TaxID=360185 RepID=UPI00082A53F9|nr:nucleoside triphosphate pyrophosphohydrolase [Amphibacillus sediminis]